jgi:hypothetical protein
MNSVLDELRETFILAVVMSNRRLTSEGLDEIFDAFEVEHPGLVDRTTRCDFCGHPLPHEDGLVDLDAMPVLAYDDGSPMYGCPACAALEDTPDA